MSRNAREISPDNPHDPPNRFGPERPGQLGDDAQPCELDSPDHPIYFGVASVSEARVIWSRTKMSTGQATVKPSASRVFVARTAQSDFSQLAPSGRSMMRTISPVN